MRIRNQLKNQQEKRLKAGTDYIGVNVVFWCHDGKGKVLMHKRSKNCRDEQGRWDCGGGAIEFGETFEDAIKREIMEEYGVKPLAVEYIITKNILRAHRGRQTHWIKNLFWVLVNQSKVKIADKEKIDEIGWFTLKNLPAPLHSQIKGEVKIIKQFFKKE